MTCQWNSSQGRGHDRLPKITFAKWRIIQRNQATCSLTNHGEVMLSVLTNHRSRNAVTLPWHQWRGDRIHRDFSLVVKCCPCTDTWFQLDSDWNYFSEICEKINIIRVWVCQSVVLKLWHSPRGEFPVWEPLTHTVCQLHGWVGGWLVFRERRQLRTCQSWVCLVWTRAILLLWESLTMTRSLWVAFSFN